VIFRTQIDAFGSTIDGIAKTFAILPMLLLTVEKAKESTESPPTFYCRNTKN
jgi:hypothetical protein